MPRKHDHTGRSSEKPRYVRLEHWIVDCPAWQSLSTNARAAWIELVRIYNGSNNGRIALDVFTLGKRLDKSKSTASRALNELEIAGFIRTEKIGSYASRNRLACEYRLTHLPCDLSHRPPSKEFASLASPEAREAFPQVGMTGAQVGTARTRTSKNQKKNPKKKAHGATGATVKADHGATGGNHIVYHGGARRGSSTEYPDLPAFLDRRVRA